MKGGKMNELNIGDKVNMLTLMAYTHTKNGKKYGKFKCECGNEKIIQIGNVKSGHVKSCGCYMKKISAQNGMKRLMDLRGKKFGKLTVLSYSEAKRKWLCKCECGNQTFVPQNRLCRKNGTKSCGCNVTLDAANSVNIVEGTNVGNVINKTALSNSKTGIRGVYFISSTGLYTSTIYFQGKRYYLGSSTDFEKIVAIRKAAEEQVYGDFIDWYYTMYPNKKKKEK